MRSIPWRGEDATQYLNSASLPPGKETGRVYFAVRQLFGQFEPNQHSRIRGRPGAHNPPGWGEGPRRQSERQGNSIDRATVKEAVSLYVEMGMENLTPRPPSPREPPPLSRRAPLRPTHLHPPPAAQRPPSLMGLK